MSGALSDDDNVDGGVKPLAAGDPSRIGPYLLLGRLGAGGMGRVYLARSEGGRTVAVKVVHEEHVSNESFRARFRREIDAARRVGERYTAPVLEADPDADRPWVATGYVPGLSLEQIVRRYGPLPADSVHALADGLLRALEDIHSAGIVHRDLKPSNVMLTVEGTRVIDFGISRALETSVESLLTSTGMVVGSPGFMSPEQVRGQRAGAKSDVFTLGCVLVYAATGKLPFGHGASNQHAVMFQIVEGEPALEAVEDEALRAFIGRCLVKDVDERPGVDELLADPERVRPAKRAGAWLPPKVVARLAQQAAQLLDAEVAPPAREEAVPADRVTVDLRKKDAADGPPVVPVVPVVAPVAGGTAPEGERRRARRRWTVAVPVVLVVTVGGGTVALIQPFGSDGGGAAKASPPAASAPVDPGAVAGSPPGVSGSPTPGASGSAGPSVPGQPPGQSPGQVGGAVPGGAPGGAAQGGAAQGGVAAGGGGAQGGGAGNPGGGAGSPGGAGGTGTDPTKGSGAAAGGAAAGGAQGGASGTQPGGSGSPSGGGSSDNGPVPAYFVGSWRYGADFNIGQPDTVIVAKSGAVRMIADTQMGHCEYTARVSSAGNGGARINISTATVDQGRSNNQFCGNLDPSFFTRSDPSGIQHNVGPAHGDGYYYGRS
ncbi:serine/threonine-protein kinase [Streptomyces sp. NPDC059104]|uniref:serine/threonine-protein kinase n=1 Tax=Streptomyces sp. NPDC059104 TaxID=3346729 RepID=UPI00368D35BE